MSDKIRKFVAKCHCGSIRLIANMLPTSLTCCNCSLCHRLGALWAYFDSTRVTIEFGDQPHREYRWGEKTITYYSCGECGCTTHYTMTEADGNELVAINSRMVPAALITDIPIREFDGLSTWKYLNE